MDTPYSTPDHLHDAGVLTASELTAFSRAEALFVLDYPASSSSASLTNLGCPTDPARQSLWRRQDRRLG